MPSILHSNDRAEPGTNGTAATRAFTADGTNSSTTVNITDEDNTAATRVLNVVKTTDASEAGNTGVFIIGLPAGVTATEVFTENITPVGQTLTWTIPEIAVGATITCSFTVKVANDLSGASTITNTAQVDDGKGTGMENTVPEDPNNPGNPYPNPQPNTPATGIPVDNGGDGSVSWKSVSYSGTGTNGAVRSGDQIPARGLFFYYSVKQNGSWPSPELLPVLIIDGYSSSHPALRQDGDLLYFVSDRPGGYGKQISGIAKNSRMEAGASQ